MGYFIWKKVYHLEKEGKDSSGSYWQEKGNGKSKGCRWKEKTVLYCYCEKWIQASRDKFSDAVCKRTADGATHTDSAVCDESATRENTGAVRSLCGGWEK